MRISRIITAARLRCAERHGPGRFACGPCLLSVARSPETVDAILVARAERVEARRRVARVVAVRAWRRAGQRITHIMRRFGMSYAEVMEALHGTADRANTSIPARGLAVAA